MHVIHSESIKGVGLVSGGPYGQDLYKLEETKNSWKTMIGEAEKAGLIDSTSNLKDAPAMVFYGTNDKVVDPETTKLQADIYKKYGANV